MKIDSLRDQELLLKQRRNIVVLGAGSIGAFVGGSLIASLADVSLIGRAAMHDRIRRHGLVMSGQHGWEARVPAGMVRYAETPVSLCTADLVIVAVKSSGTLEAAKQILGLAPRTALVASFQNGLDNLSVLRARLPRHTVLGTMVPFNVVQMDDGRLHRGTSGEIVVEAHPRWTAWASTFRSARLPLQQRPDFREVQWGKLVLNLNNAVNALSGRPLRTQLMDRRYRLVLAALIDEALAAMDAAGIRPAQLGDTAPAHLPALLRLSDEAFMVRGSALSKIDARARSSMWEDLEAQRLTEVDELNGAVVALARSQGKVAPVNEMICKLVHAAEHGGERHIEGGALLQALAVADAFQCVPATTALT